MTPVVHTDTVGVMKTERRVAVKAAPQYFIFGLHVALLLANLVFIVSEAL